MKQIEEKIHDFISDLETDHDLFKYIYNTKSYDVAKEGAPVYYSGQYWDRKEIIAMLKAILLGKWFSSGEHVYKFELAFSKKFNTEYSVMVNSGSSANLVMLAAVKKVLCWEDHDEIIVSSVGFPTTISTIVQNNLKPVFIDIEYDTLNFDLNLIEAKITSRTRAIFVSPVLGNSPDLDKIMQICDLYGLRLLLDNCDSLGSSWKGKYLNEYALASSCSFYPAHHISTGEGGMVSSNNMEIIDTARSIAWWGRACYCVGAANLLPCGTCKTRFSNWLSGYDNVIDHKYVFTNIGYNLKPLDLQGAIGLVQIDKFDEIHEKRRKSKNSIAAVFKKHLPFLRIPDELENSSTSWFGTPVICEDIDQKKRLVAHLEENNIQTRNYFAGNILMHPAYQHLGNYKDYPQANKVLDMVFFIGAAPHYTDIVFERIESVIQEFRQ